MLLSYPRPIDLVTPTAALGAVGRLLSPVVRLIQRVVNLFWVSGFLFLRGLLLLLRERIQVLHLNNGVSVGNELLVASKLLGIRCVIHQRGIAPVTPWSGWLARRADHVISRVGGRASESGQPGPRARNGAPPSTTASTWRSCSTRSSAPRGRFARALGIGDDQVIVGLAGMIRPWKGQMVLVQAMAELHRRYPQVVALIMGGVSDKAPADRIYLNQLREYIDAHDLKSCVTILDYQANAPEFLQTFDVMVHTAVDPEPFSRVVIEGMALGRPIVASATGGTPEAIDDGGCGFLVPGGDLMRSRTASRGWSTTRRCAPRSAARAREKVERRFLIQDHVSRTEAVYRRIAGRQ